MYLTDIPLMYTFLMLLTPIGLYLLVKGRTSWMLGVSSALWLAFQLFPTQTQMPWPIVGNTTFNLVAWQLLFFVGMTVGFHRNDLTKKISQIPRGPYLIFSALAMVWLIQIYSSRGALWGSFFPKIDATALTTELFSKSAQAPGRLIASLIVFTYLTVTKLWKPISSTLGWLLMPLGQNSLYGYTIYVLVIGALYIALPFLPYNIQEIGPLNTSLQLLAVLTIWGMIQSKFLFNIIPR